MPAFSSTKFGGTAADIGGGGNAWTSPGNLLANDGVSATVTLGVGTNSTRLQISNFGFAIPANAVITGITVDVKFLDGIPGSDGALQASAVAVKSSTGLGGTVVVSLATTGQSFGSGVKWPTSFATQTFGSQTNLKGLIQPPGVNSANFNLDFLVTRVGGTTNANPQIDYMNATIFYDLVDSGGVL